MSKSSIIKKIKTIAKSLVLITLCNGETIKASPDHVFYNERQEYLDKVDITNGPGVTTAKGVKGGHNEIEFQKEVYDAVNAPNKRVAIINNTPSSNNGWSLIEYKLYKADGTGNPIIPLQLGSDVYYKTVYNPNVISGSQLKSAGYKSYKYAIDNPSNLNLGSNGTGFNGISNSIEYTGFFDEITKIIVTWYVKN